MMKKRKGSAGKAHGREEGRKREHGRFISSRIHPFPSEHGSKDAQSQFSTIMFTQMGTSGNLPFMYSLLFALPVFLCFCFLWRLLYIFSHLGIPSFFLSAAVYFFSFSLITCAVSWCSWLSHHFYVVRVPGSSPGETTFFLLPFQGSFFTSSSHPFDSVHLIQPLHFRPV